MKTALITGITGQDGAYLARHLLNEGYRVVGTRRRSASTNTWRLDELGITDRVEIATIEMLEFGSILSALQESKPDEIYNLAAQSFVGASFGQPIFTMEANAVAVYRLLESIRIVNPEARLYQASTSEMFGGISAESLNETSRFYPKSPYAVSKVAAHMATTNYREAHGMFCCNGILFNHESPLRGAEFVTRKITTNLARIALGDDRPLTLGNIDARRDWGYAEDYCRGMHMMMTRGTASDYVLATGVSISVRDFFQHAAEALGMEIVFEGKGAEEVAHDRKSGKCVLRIDPGQYRPAEVKTLIGDASKARRELGWAPEVEVGGLAAMMARSDLERLKRGATLL
ncbi:MAG: GDP-mannose 4,6-dehydratase [Nisaea sp.]|uniref:GDP-mannose 4,6-dehydratase n=1 Tax=Nisaea sp. TaxID=2024842 RepID=UPI001B112A76|nr:GDP-mannose 4,6-dehydratase [Nisaea sp.]MBO6560051.1 GDP-mannose 4,6-dehydratase [Nisaea sp.]